MPRYELEAMTNRQGITYAESNFITWFYSQFDNRSAANRRIINVEPLYYQGAIGGTEFLVYAATKLYLCFDCQFSVLGVDQIAALNAIIYNEANAIFTYCQNNVFNFDSTDTLWWSASGCKLKNIYFSRIAGQYSHIVFNGFRITLV